MKSCERLARERAALYLAEHLKAEGIPALWLEGVDVTVGDENADGAFAIAVHVFQKKGWIVEMTQPRNGFAHLEVVPENQYALEML